MHQSWRVLVPANSNDFCSVSSDVVSQSRQLFQEVQECPGIARTSSLTPICVLKVPQGPRLLSGGVDQFQGCGGVSIFISSGAHVGDFEAVAHLGRGPVLRRPVRNARSGSGLVRSFSEHDNEVNVTLMNHLKGEMKFQW